MNKDGAKQLKISELIQGFILISLIAIIIVKTFFINL